MRMDLDIPVAAAATADAPGPCRHGQKTSALQVPPLKQTNGSLAVCSPVLRYDREYLKALRQAELAAWNASPAQTRVIGFATTTPVRLPRPIRSKAESRLHFVLASVCLAALTFALCGLAWRAPQWHNFVQFVRHLLA